MVSAVFLDRDGVINRAVVRDGHPYPPATAQELEVLPGVDAACAALHAAGLKLIVVTNQPDVARGTQCRAEVERMHRALQARLPLDEVRVCYHTDADACSCRKPAPGMLLAAASEHHIDMSASFLVGDRWRDIEAGRQAGCRTVFLDYGYAETLRSDPDHTTHTLADAATWILMQHAALTGGRC